MPLRITLGNLLHECAEKFSEREFLVIAETGETLTYTEFEILTNRITNGLLEHFPEKLEYIDIFLDQMPRTSNGKPEKGKLSFYWTAS